MDVSEFALSSVLCFRLSKHGKLHTKRVKQLLLDYYQVEDNTTAKQKLLVDTEFGVER